MCKKTSNIVQIKVKSIEKNMPRNMWVQKNIGIEKCGHSSFMKIFQKVALQFQIYHQWSRIEHIYK